MILSDTALGEALASVASELVQEQMRAVSSIAAHDAALRERIANLEAELSEVCSERNAVEADLVALRATVDAVLICNGPRIREHWRDGRWVECATCRGTWGVAADVRVRSTDERHAIGCWYYNLLAARKRLIVEDA
jgi:hypothetical protein